MCSISLQQMQVKGDWTIVARVTLVTFFEEWGNDSLLPVGRYLASV